MSVETLSESWFDRYLGEHGYKWATHPDYGIGKFPDREIRRGGLTAVCEIKQFDTDPASHLGTGGGYVDRYGLIRGAIKAAADQLRPLEDSAMPLVVVLANPRNVMVDLSMDNLWYALYGDEAVQLNVWPGDGPEPNDFDENVQVIAGRNGQIRNVHQYISAVAVLCEDWQGRLAVETIETLSASAVRLPHGLFNAPQDRRWAPDYERGRIVLL